MEGQDSGSTENGRVQTPLPLSSFNHISRNCRDIEASLEFYVNVLGFVPVKRPEVFNFEGAWLFNYGIGIHLLQKEESDGAPASKHPEEINPRADHISFHCDDIDLVSKGLDAAGIKYLRRAVEGGVDLEQLFFLDPDGFMVEVCTCEKLPIEPLVGDQQLMSDHLHNCYREPCKRLQPSCIQGHERRLILENKSYTCSF